MRTGALVVLTCSLATGCSTAIDRFMVRGPIGAQLRIADLPMACAAGSGTVGISSGLNAKHPPRRALAILESTAAACSELQAMEYELAGEYAGYWVEGEQKVAAVKDAREQERRARAVTAGRLDRGFGQIEALYGVVGEGCPKFKKDADEFAYLLGLVAGANALLQDKSAGGEVGVSDDVLGKVGRGAACLDSARWWHLPAALQAGSWAMVPGSGPAGVDPWQALEDAAAMGDATGLRAARGVQVQLAANAGRDQDVARGIKAFAAVSTPPPADYILLDDYAEVVVRHQADLLWMKARGYRAAKLGSLPGDEARPTGPVDDPFASDPFASDPFAEDPAGNEPAPQETP